MATKVEIERPIKKSLSKEESPFFLRTIRGPKTSTGKKRVRYMRGSPKIHEVLKLLHNERFKYSSGVDILVYKFEKGLAKVHLKSVLEFLGFNLINCLSFNLIKRK